MERRINVTTGAVSVLFGAVALVQALRDLDFLGVNNEPGPGLFPELMAAALVVLGVLLIATQFRAGDTEPETDAPASEDGRERFIRAFVVWVALVVSIPLVVTLGFVVAMLVLAGFVILFHEKQRSWSSVAIVALLPVLAYVLFAVLLGVRLPLGVFES